jgi:hypothetical protein
MRVQPLGLTAVKAKGKRIAGKAFCRSCSSAAFLSAGNFKIRTAPAYNQSWVAAGAEWCLRLDARQ